MVTIPSPEQWARMSWHQRQQLLGALRSCLRELAQAQAPGWDAYQLRLMMAQLQRLERSQPP